LGLACDFGGSAVFFFFSKMGVKKKEKGGARVAVGGRKGCG
jgi:hypothetical protein